jgi:hypothetical protein
MGYGAERAAEKVTAQTILKAAPRGSASHATRLTFAVVVAGGGRPVVRSGGLVEAAVLPRAFGGAIGNFTLTLITTAALICASKILTVLTEPAPLQQTWVIRSHRRA